MMKMAILAMCLGSMLVQAATEEELSLAVLQAFFFADALGIDVGSHADRNANGWTDRGTLQQRINRAYVIEGVRTCSDIVLSHPGHGSVEDCLKADAAMERNK